MIIVSGWWMIMPSSHLWAGYNKGGNYMMSLCWINEHYLSKVDGVQLANGSSSWLWASIMESKRGMWKLLQWYWWWEFFIVFLAGLSLQKSDGIVFKKGLCCVDVGWAMKGNSLQNKKGDCKCFCVNLFNQSDCTSPPLFFFFFLF